MGDEMWRRGDRRPDPAELGADVTIVELDGPSEPSTSTTDSSSSSTDGDGQARPGPLRTWWIALALVIASAVAAGAVLFWPRSDDPVATDEVVPQRSELEPVWSVVFDGRVDEVRIAEGGVFVMSALEGLVVRYDLDTGDEVWSTTIGDARDPGVFEVVDDLVLVGTRLRSNRGQAQIGRIHVLDRDDGSEVWREATTAARYGATDEVVVRRVSVQGGTTGQLLDVRTGEPLGEVLGLDSAPRSAGNVVASGLGESVRVLSLVDGTLVRPEIPAADVELVVGVGADVIAIGSFGEILRIERDGTLTTLAATQADPAGAWASLDEFGDAAVVTVGDVTERIDLGADSAESRWQIPAEAGPPTDTRRGPAAIAQRLEPDRSTSYALVDLDDGDTLWTTEPGVRRVQMPTLLADGVLLPPRIGESKSLSALDIDGNELWTVDLPGTLTATAVGEAAVAVASRTDDTSTVTVYR